MTPGVNIVAAAIGTRGAQRDEDWMASNRRAGRNTNLCVAEKLIITDCVGKEESTVALEYAALKGWEMMSVCQSDVPLGPQYDIHDHNVCSLLEISSRFKQSL